jgi:hypothetical protein
MAVAPGRNSSYRKITTGGEECAAGRVQKYSVKIKGKEYPTRQVVALGTGRPSIEFTSAAAYRILQKFGFEIDVWE